ncbi:hypothetical protein P775_16475 [Puniceibacterium antarcticum]|uniref:Transposase IS66 central domain-containing protein n=1 Tax=Puniceibacterium antarcticum TaxID=1206336 RepID=A0A2G8RBZ8_9RHOB|nr:hypothetical protein P775_16475 [Puniceibacterium antarcticum]
MDGLPLYRQEGIYARDGLTLDRRLMAQWMGRAGFELDILADHVLREILKGGRVFADETSLPTLAPGTGHTKKAWLWAYPETTRLLAEAVRPWWPIVSRTADPVTACDGISGDIAVSCRCPLGRLLRNRLPGNRRLCRLQQACTQGRRQRWSAVGGVLGAQPTPLL